MKNDHIFLILIIFSCIILKSCAFPTYYKIYDGPALPKEKVAFLITDFEDLFFSARAIICSVDGKKVEVSKMDGTIRVEVLPGYHTVEFYYVFSSATTFWKSKKPSTLEFDAKPGHIYLLRANNSYPSGNIGRANSEIMDITSNPRRARLGGCL